jgi:hypothetical protein
MSVGPRLRIVRPASELGVMSTRPFAHPSALEGREPFRHHLRSQIFFGNSGLSEQEPITEEELPFEERAEELTEGLIRGTMFLPYPVYTGPYDSEPYYQVAGQTSATVADRESGLFSEIDRLRDEVRRLREGQVSREQARPAAVQPQPSVEEKTPTTILVFRDGRRSEIQNYAIVGQTLWVFTERRAHKMPIADLDVEATKNVNDARGVEFRLP